jgi:ankyrin repeat protein
MQVIYPIHEAARLGDLEQIKFLFKNTPDLIDSTDDKKLTALHFAAANRQLAVARMLLGFRATVDPRSGSGQTPLHLAAKNGDLAIARLLADQPR